jgi:MHS family alpha-ketoglutarate permease-like MFS transporter
MTAPSDEHDTRRRILAIVAASSGNLVEWFDFYVYAFASLYFAPSFFPKGDRTVQLLDTAGVFAAGFLMRPIGGWLFGRIADRHGRKRALVVSVALMSIGSLLVACVPTYATIGAAAPALLLGARLLQGLSVGGEYGATATYMSEVAARGRRGFYSSFQYTTLIGGQLLAVLMIVVLEHTLTDAQLRAWGWRLAFLAGAVTAVAALLLRNRLHETQTEASRVRAAGGTIAGLWREHAEAMVSVFVYTAGGSLFFYAFTTYMQKYLVNTLGMTIRTASWVMTAALLVYAVMQPPFGALSDRIGRRRSLLAFSSLACIGVVPIVTALRHTRSAPLAFVLIVVALAILSFYTSIAGIIKAEMFPAEVRALGVGFAYALGNALFGGTAEYVALWLKSRGHEPAFATYIAVMMIAVFVVAWRMPQKAPYLDDDGAT